MQEDTYMRAMIADYMDNGFLENIIDMFRHDKTLYPLVADLMIDERVRVRIGVTALVEALARADSEGIASSVEGITGLLKNTSPTIRGDAAYLLGVIGKRDAIPFLQAVLMDENPDVRQIAKEAIADIVWQSTGRQE